MKSELSALSLFEVVDVKIVMNSAVLEVKK